jgi:tetratricopeptide (TPR) repeat protein
MDSVARALTWQRQFEKARQLFEEVIALRRQVLGAEHRDTLTSMSSLATVLREQQQFEEARRLHAQTLEIRCRVLGAEDPDSLASMGELAVVLFQQERLAKARALLEKALPAQRRVLGSEHPDTLGSIHSLAYVLVRLGHFAEACKLYEEALEIQRRVLGPSHLDTMASTNNLAWLLATAPDPKLRAPARALELAREVVRLKPDERNSWNTLGTAQYRAGHWQEAIASLKRSMDLHRMPDADSDFAYNGFFLAMAHWQLAKEEKTSAPQLARRQEARKWYEDAVTWMEKNKPKDQELIWFRAEAAELLGIKEPPKAPMK